MANNEIINATVQTGGLIQGGRSQHSGSLSVQADVAVAMALGAMQLAQQFPRNPAQCMVEIDRACERQALAAKATYLYQRGGQDITGPSIRLAEAVAQAWGNIEFGFNIIDETRTTSTVLAYAIDLQRNQRVQRQFTVRHERQARGSVVPLTDPRDIYEHVSNFSQRKVRQCILAVLPGWVMERAVERCAATMRTSAVDPAAIQKMVAAFAKLGVSVEQLAARQGKPVERFGPDDRADLLAIFAAIQDDESSVESFFGKVSNGGGQSDRVAAAAKKAAAKKAPEPATDTVSEMPPDAAEPDDLGTVDILLAKIEAAKNANELSLAERQIEEAVMGDLITADEAAMLQAAFERRAL
jgi:hypothetical protein